MNEQKQDNKKQVPEDAPKKTVGEYSAAKSSSGWKSLLSKRWISPAIFLAAAAIIVTLMWIYQGADEAKETTTNTPVDQSQEGDIANKDGDKAIEVSTGNESFEWPVTNYESLAVIAPFYDKNGTEAEKEAAVIQIGDTFSPHMGIDFADPDGKSFDVLAVLSGKVTEVYQHATNGMLVEIEHVDGLVSVYQSLTDVLVGKGDEVLQGTKIASAGRNDAERDQGVHLHFELRKDGKSVNPNDLIED